MLSYTVIPVRSNTAAMPIAIDRTRRADLPVGMTEFVPGQLPVKRQPVANALYCVTCSDLA